MGEHIWGSNEVRASQQPSEHRQPCRRSSRHPERRRPFRQPVKGRRKLLLNVWTRTITYLATKYLNNSVGPLPSIETTSFCVSGDMVDMGNLALSGVSAENVDRLVELLGLEYDSLESL